MSAIQFTELNRGESDGLVWIKNGKVFIKDKTGNGLPPLINPCNGVKLYINGEEYNHLTAVKESDSIELEPVNTEVELELDTEISEDRLKCYLIFSPAKIVGYIIQDAEPANKLDIQATQVVIETKKTDCGKILDYLKHANIVFGIRMDVLAEICESNKPGKYLIAEGSPPEESTDGY